MSDGVRKTRPDGVVQTRSDGVVRTTPETLTWDTATEWGNAQSQSLVTHLQPTGTDWSATDTIQLVPGLPSDEGGTSLEGYWPLDEDSGSTANDISGNTHDGSITGATVGTSAILGSTGYSFDGADDNVDVGDVNALEGIQNLTLSAWVNLQGLTSGASDNSMTVYGFGDGFDNWLELAYEGDTSNKFKAQVENGGTSLFAESSTTFETTGVWHHVALTVSGGTDLTLYVDGASEGTDSLGSAISTTTTTNAHRIGSISFQTDRVVNGHLDEVRAYTRTLSAAEISTLALGDSPTAELVTAAKNSTLGLPTDLTTTTTIPANTSVDVVVHQDTTKDGTSDNSETVSLAGGTDETNSLTASNFTDSADADYWVAIQPSVTNPTDTAPTLSKVAVTIG